MSNAKLKEQIEAAKVALVHSVEIGTSADMPKTPDTMARVPSTSENHVQPQITRPADNTQTATNPNTRTSDQDMSSHEMMPQIEYNELETRLRGLEDKISNQQRDLHTLLQKLRDITAKSQAAAKPQKNSGAKKWLVGGLICVLGLGAVFYGLGVEAIAASLYYLTGLVVAFVDMLASKI